MVHLRYRRVSCCIWNDDKFPFLSDDCQLVIFHLLTTPQSSQIGLYKASIEGLAAEKRWPLRRYQKAFQEAVESGFVQYDPNALLVYLPNYLKYNQPENPNVLKSWSKTYHELPSSPLKNAFYLALSRVSEGFGKGFSKWFAKGFAEWFGKGFTSKPFAKQEQEQEQEQEQKVTVSSSRMLAVASTDSPPLIWEGTFFGVDEVLWRKLLSEYPAIPDEDWLKRFLSKIDDYIRDNPRKYKRDLRGRVKSPSAIIRNWLERETIRPQPKTIEEKARERGLL